MRRFWAGLGVVLLLLVPVGAFWLCTRAAAFNGQLDTVLSGDPGRYLGDIGRGVLVDFGFVAAFLVAGLTSVLVARHWLPPFRQFSRRPAGPKAVGTPGGMWWSGWIAIAVAAALDTLENVLLVLAPARPPTWFAVLVAMVGWWKLAAYAASVVVLVVVPLGTTVGAAGSMLGERVFAAVTDRFSKSPDTTTQARRVPGAVPQENLAICVSGGGIRAASVALGALRRFDAPRDGGSLFRRAAWLFSVSGGGYTAGGWRISRQRSGTSRPFPDRRYDGLFEAGGPWSTWVADHRRYLANGPFGLVWAALTALVRCSLVLAAVGGSALVLGWLAGAFVNWGLVVGAELESSTLPTLSAHSVAPYLAARLWLPGAAPLVVAVLSMLPGGGPNRLSRVAGGIGAALLTVVFVLPFVVGLGPSVLVWLVEALTPVKETSVDGTTLGRILAIVSGLGVGAALGGLVTKRLQKVWLRLGGYLLGVLLAVVLVTTARAVATGPGVWGGGIADNGRVFLPWLVVIALGVLLVVNLWDAHRMTLAGIYRKQLSRTFATQRRCCTTEPIPYDEELAWQQLVDADGPELVICATVQSSKQTVSGVHGAGLTFSARSFTMYDGSDGGASVVSAEFPRGSAWRGYPRTWSVSRALAISGAAVASSMGRQSLGTTNALIAALNVRLGMWLPNPSRMDLFQAGGEELPVHLQPRVGFSYLVKEVFGKYDLTSDPFVYVSDGGHRENLALVEALRFRPQVVFAVDASGDKLGTFKTLQEAIDLAEVELGATIEMIWDPILTRPATEGAPLPLWPVSCATTARIAYDDGTEGRLFYGRYQLSEQAPADLRAFAAEHAGFPNYSTANQFLDRDVHLALVRLGEHVADEIVQLYESRPAIPSTGSSPAGS